MIRKSVLEDKKEEKMRWSGGRLQDEW